MPAPWFRNADVPALLKWVYNSREVPRLMFAQGFEYDRLTACPVGSSGCTATVEVFACDGGSFTLNDFNPLAEAIRYHKAHVCVGGGTESVYFACATPLQVPFDSSNDCSGEARADWFEAFQVDEYSGPNNTIRPHFAARLNECSMSNGWSEYCVDEPPRYWTIEGFSDS